MDIASWVSRLCSSFRRAVACLVSFGWTTLLVAFFLIPDFHTTWMCMHTGTNISWWITWSSWASVRLAMMLTISIGFFPIVSQHRAFSTFDWNYRKKQRKSKTNYYPTCKLAATDCTAFESGSLWPVQRIALFEEQPSLCIGFYWGRIFPTAANHFLPAVAAKRITPPPPEFITAKHSYTQPQLVSQSALTMVQTFWVLCSLDKAYCYDNSRRDSYIKIWI